MNVVKKTLFAIFSFISGSIYTQQELQHRIESRAVSTFVFLFCFSFAVDESQRARVYCIEGASAEFVFLLEGWDRSSRLPTSIHVSPNYPLFMNENKHSFHEQGI